MSTGGSICRTARCETIKWFICPRRRFRVADALQAVACSEDLSEATNFLHSLRFFGLVRRFEESCRGFEACYGRTFRGLKMRPIRENASTNETLGESEALKSARDELGEATYAETGRSQSLRFGAL